MPRMLFDRSYNLTERLELTLWCDLAHIGLGFTSISDWSSKGITSVTLNLGPLGLGLTLWPAHD